jgi:hypothetical protein
MSTAAAPNSARASRSFLFVAIRGAVIPTARSQGIPEDARSVTSESETVREQSSVGFVVSVDLHAVYAITLPSGNDSVKPPQRPIINTAFGLGETDGSVLLPNATSALLLAFRGPIPLTMNTKLFGPQLAGEVKSAEPTIFRTGSASILEAAKM